MGLFYVLKMAIASVEVCGMRTIIIKEVEDREERKKNEVKPDPVITRPGKARFLPFRSTEPTTTDHYRPPSAQDLLLSEQWTKMKDVKVERSRLSNAARERWLAGADQAEMKLFYAKIQEFTDEAKLIFALIKHIEKFGELPRETKDDTHVPNSDILLMKERKRQLINQRDKLRRKLKPNARQPENKDRRSMWEQNLALLDAEYEEVDRKIKKLNYDSRD